MNRNNKPAPSNDTVSRAVYDQVRWERDMAMEQLEEHSIPFGGIARDVLKVTRCKNCAKHGHCDTEKSFIASGIDNPYCCAGEKNNNQFKADDIAKEIERTTVEARRQHYQAWQNFWKKKQQLEEQLDSKRKLLEDALPVPLNCGVHDASNITRILAADLEETPEIFSFLADRGNIHEGQVMYVRERWRLKEAGSGSGGSNCIIEYKTGESVIYPAILCRTDREYWGNGEIDWRQPDAWKPPTEMPKLAARIIAQVIEIEDNTCVPGTVIVTCRVIGVEKG